MTDGVQQVIAGGALDLLAAMLVLAALGGLFLAWRRRNRAVAILSAAPVVGAVATGAAGHGIEYASVYVFMALTLGAWLVVYFNRDFRSTRRDMKPHRRLQRPSLSSVGRTLGYGMLAGPLAALAGLLSSLAAVAWLPGDAANRLVPGIFLFIGSWAALTVWTLAANRSRRPALVMLLLIGLSGAWLGVGAQP